MAKWVYLPMTILITLIFALNLEMIETAKFEHMGIINLTDINMEQYSTHWEMDFSDNNIESIPPDIFSALVSARTLDLSYNKIGEVLNDGWRGLMNLEDLYLRSNNLTVVENCMFEYLDNLIVLSLADNMIQEIKVRGSSYFNNNNTLKSKSLLGHI